MEQQTVLFSGIGNSDPWRNSRDGSMLHIVRHYEPDYVLLFFTKSIWEGEQGRAGQAHYDWEKIIQSVSPKTEVDYVVQEIARPNDYDGYTEIFHHYVQTLEEKFPNATILFNVSSGTPQMGTALCLEYITYPANKICIQVDTPQQGSNVETPHETPDSQAQDLIIVNENEREATPRYRELEIRSFHETIIRGQVKSLIANYDYSAAVRTLEQERSIRNHQVLLEELQEITHDIQQHRVFQTIVERYDNLDLQKALFHTILLKMYHARDDIAEVLIRVKSIAEFIAEKYVLEKYPGVIRIRDGRGYFNKSEQNKGIIVKYKEFLESQRKKFQFGYPLSFPAFVDLLNVLEGNSEFVGLLRQILKINGLRNSVAHRLEALPLDQNENRSKINKSVKSLKQLLLIQYPEVDQEDFNYLQQFNAKIEELL